MNSSDHTDLSTMSTFRCSFYVAVVCILVSCQTVRNVSLDAEAKAEQDITAAYNRADEKALIAQNEADERTDQVIAEANAEIERIQERAHLKAEAAYERADSIEKTMRSEHAGTQQKKLLEATLSKVKEIRDNIALLDSKMRYAAASTSDETSQVEHTIALELEEASRDLNRIKTLNFNRSQMQSEVSGQETTPTFLDQVRCHMSSL